MNVLFLTHRLPYAPNRGDRIRAYYLMREMSRFASVRLFSLVHDDDEESQAGAVPFAKSVTTARVRRGRGLWRGVTNLLTGRPLTHALLDAPGCGAALADLVRASAPDVIVSFCSGMARFALAAPLDQFPLVLDLVDVDSAKWAAMAGTNRGARRWVYGREARTLGAFEAAAAARARATLVVNAREAEALKALAPSANVRIIENGVDVESFQPPSAPADASVTIFCGVLSYQPNEDGVRWFAADVWPRIRAAVPSAQFLIVGSGATATIRTLAARDSSIQLVGAVDRVQPHLWRAAVSVAPLLVARGLQNKVLEALAAGLPVVITPAVDAGLPDEARQGCTVASDPTAFADAVATLLTISADARRARARRADLARLTWADRLAPLEGILREAAIPA